MDLFIIDHASPVAALQNHQAQVLQPEYFVYISICFKFNFVIELDPFQQWGNAKRQHTLQIWKEIWQHQVSTAFLFSVNYTGCSYIL